MARKSILSPTRDLNTDDGAVLISVIHGEQTRMAISLGWLTNLTGYAISAKAVEANNVQGFSGGIPRDPLSGGNIQSLTIIDNVVADRNFEIVIPETLIDSYATTPEPGQPIYAFFELEVKDGGAGANQLVWKPVRGLIEVRYSPTEAN